MVTNALLIFFFLLIIVPLTLLRKMLKKALKDHLLQRCFILRSCYIGENVLENIDCRL